VICIGGTTAKIYAWNDWSEIACVRLNIDINGLQLKSVTPYMSEHRWRVLLELSEKDGSPITSGLHLLDGSSFDITDDPVKKNFVQEATAKDDIKSLATEDEAIAAAVSSLHLEPHLSRLAHLVTHILGLRDPGKVFFLDTHSWVCSANLEDLGSVSLSYNRHFFVPYDWFSGTRDVIGAVTERDVIFARHDHVAIIQNGLEYVEKVDASLEYVGKKGMRGFR